MSLETNMAIINKKPDMESCNLNVPCESPL